MLNKVAIAELDTEDSWREAFPILRELRPTLPLDSFLKNRSLLVENNYRLFGLRDEGCLYTVASVVVSPHVLRIKDFWIHDFVTLEGSKSRGYGSKMIQYLRNLAKNEGFDRICLYTQAGNKRAQSFYENKVSLDNYGIVYIRNTA